MVASIAAEGLGLFNSSLNTVGQTGPGKTDLGQGNQDAYVNIATGNLVLQQRDEVLVAQGSDYATVRTYNSQGVVNDLNTDNFHFSYSRKITSDTGIIPSYLNNGIIRIGDDGHQTMYRPDPNNHHVFISTDGKDAHDTLTYYDATMEWVWTEGSTQQSEVYDGTTGQLIAILDAKNTAKYDGSFALKNLSGLDVATRNKTIEATYFFYNVQGYVTRIEDASGQVMSLEYASATRSIYHPYNLVGMTTTNALNQSSKTVRYTYDSLDRLTDVAIDLSPADGSIVDGNVYLTHYTYLGSTSLITRVNQSDGTVLRITYVQNPANGQYLVKTVQQGEGNNARVTRYDYFLSENRTDAVQVLDINYVPENDSNLVTTQGVGVGYVTSFYYDAKDRLVQTLSAADENGQRQASFYTYDADDNLVQFKDAKGAVTVFHYDDKGNQIESRDAVGNVVQLQYNEHNQVLRQTTYAVGSGSGSATPAVPHTKRYVYDAFNRVRFIVDANGAVTENRYDDSRGNGTIVGGNVVSTLTYTLNTFDVSALDATLASYLSASGNSVLQEHWDNIPGDDVSQLTGSSAYPYNPTSRGTLSSFEIPQNSGNNYGDRIRGYVQPTVSGLYTFWIASDDESALYLSTDDNPANKVKIAGVDDHTVPVAFRAWDTYPEQKSVQIQLQAGQRYYIEALHKENTSSDHLSVAWQTTGLSRQIISGQNLAFNPAWVPSTISLADLQNWVTTTTNSLAASGKQGIQRTDKYYDFRGQLAESIAYNAVDAQGVGVNNGQEQVISYVYDQRGNLIKTVDVRGQGDEPVDQLSLPSYTHSRGTDQGLTAEYFSDETLTNRVLTRTDANVNFNVGYNPIAPGLPSDHVSARWTGYIGTAHQQGLQDYTFYVASDDGVRLWVDGQLVIDSWVTNPGFERQGHITLEAGRRYSIKLEYFEHEGISSAQLSWKTTGVAKQVIDPGYFFTADAANAETVPDTIARGANAGLTAQYFDNPDFTNLVATRVDSGINFDQMDLPANQDNFSVRWQGKILPAHGQGVQTYTFATSSDDSIRVWVNNQLVIDGWNQPWNPFNDPNNWFGTVVDNLGNRQTGTISLEAGKLYDIRVDYVHHSGSTHAKLYWASAGLDAQLVSPRDLYALGTGPAVQPVKPANQTSYVYDGLNRLIATTDALGQTSTIQYDSLNQRIVTTQANGLRVTDIYDTAGARIQSINSDASNLAAITTIGTTRYHYDVAGRLISKQDATGVKTYYLYDEIGRRTGVIDGNGILTETVYDGVGRAIKTIVHDTPVDLHNLNDAGVADNAIAYFAFNETSGNAAVDSGTSNVAGLIGSGVALGAPGRTLSGNTAYSFNGTDAAKVVVANPALNINTGTVEAWVKTQDAGQGMRALLAKEGAYGLFLNNNELVAYNYDANPVQPPAGLTAQYYTGQNFDHLVETRIDPNINFDAGYGNVSSAVGYDNLSIRWTGKLKTAHTSGSQSYTFYATADDGMRLWIDGQLVLDNWSGTGATQATVTLTAGLHDIRAEYHENIATANAKLQWSTTGVAQQVIAQQYFLSAAPFDPAQHTGVFLNDNQWHHVAMTFTADVTNGAKVYVDGKYVLTTTVHSANTPTATLPLANGNNNLWIGAREGVSGSSYNGLLDEVAVYNQRLSDATIRAHALDAIDFSKGPQWIDSPSLYLRLNDQSGAVARDDSGSSFNGSVGSGVQLGQTDAPPPYTDPFVTKSASAQFDGSSSASVVVPSQSALQLENGTLEAWLKTGNAGTGLRTIAGKDGAYGLFLQNNELVTYNFNANPPQPQPGLVAQYYSDTNLTNLVATRVDSNIDSPALGSVPAATGSVRWTGQVQTAPGTGTQNYTFYATADDAVRVWVNGQLVIDQWQYNGGVERSGTIALSAGQRYDIRVEYRKFYGASHITLKWSSASVPKAVVGSTNLYTIKQYDPFVHTGIYLNDNQWHNVQLQFNNNVANGSKVLVDGQVVLQTTLNSGVAGKAFYVGGGAGFTDNLDKSFMNITAQSFTGLISNVAVYNHALTPVQIESHQTGLYETGLQIGQVRPSSSANDRIVDNVYDDAGQLRYKVDGEGSVEEFRYDGAGLLLQDITYDHAYTRAQLQNSGGQITLQSVSAAIAGTYPNTAAVSASQSRVLQYGYDAAGRLRFSVDADNYLTEYRYDAAGQQVEKINYATPIQQSLATTDLVNVALIDSIRPAAAYKLLPDGRQIAQDRHEYQLYNLLGQTVSTIGAEGQVTENQYDPSGNVVTRIEYATPLSQQELNTALSAVNYDASRLTLGGATADRTLGQIRPLTTVADRVTRYEYDALNRQIKEIDFQGTVTETKYNAADLVVEQRVNTGAGETARIAKASYDVLGNRITQITPLANTYGVQKTATYDAVGRMTATIDELGHKTVYYYDNDGQLLFRVNADGEVVEYQYNAFGQQSAIVLYANRIDVTGLAGGLVASEVRVRLNKDTQKDSRIELRYNRRGQKTQSVDGEGYLTQFGYDALADLRTQIQQISATDSATTTFAYNKRGLLTQKIGDATGIAQSQLTDYDAFGRVASVTDGNGNVTRFYSDRSGRVIESLDALNGIAKTTYDAFDRIVTQTDTLNKSTQFQYSDQNRTLTATSPEGIVVTQTFDRFGEQISVTDGRGNTTHYGYDADGNLTSVTDAAGNTKTATFDALDQLKTSVDEKGIVTTYTYDAAGRELSRTLDPTGLALTTNVAFDGKGQKIRSTDAAGRVTEMTYDRNGQLVRQVKDPSGLNLITQFDYDGAGNQVRVREGDANGFIRETTYQYDHLNRLKQVTIDPSGLALSTNYFYDQNDNVVAVADATGALSYSIYDALNRKIFHVDAEGGVVKTDYDAEGRIVKTTAYANKVATQSLSAIATNPANSLSLLQNVLTASAADESEYRVYDGDGRLRYSVDSLGQLTNTQYDNNSNVTQRTRYAHITVASLNLNVANLTAAVLDQALASTTLTSTADQTQRWTYDALNRVTTSTDALGNSEQFSYDAVGNVLSTTDVANNVTTYSYDAANRVVEKRLPARTILTATGEQQIAAVTQFDYDAVGNIKEKREAVGTAQELRTQYVYDKADRLTDTIVDVGGLAAHTQTIYNSVGDAVQSINANGDSAYVLYDAAGRERYRIDYTRAVVENRYNGRGELIATVEYANPLAGTVNLSALTVATITQYLTIDAAHDRTTQMLRDNLGRVKTRIDAGNYQTNYSYDAFGNATGQTQGDHASREIYDALNRVIYRLDAENDVQSYQYDAFGNVVATRTIATSYTAQNGAPTTAAAATAANLAAFIAAHATVNDAATYSFFDNLNRETARIDAEGYVTALQYDSRGNITTETRYGKPLTATEIAQSLQQGAVVAPNTQSGNYQNHVTTSTYNALNQRVTETNYLGLVDITKYDGLDRVVLNDDGGRQTKTQFDALNNVVGESNALDVQQGKTTLNSYDNNGRLLKSTNELGATTTYYYDKDGRVRFVIDALGEVREKRYNAFGEVTEEIIYGNTLSNVAALSGGDATQAVITQMAALADASKDSHTITSYDQRGLVSSVTDAMGYVTLSEYDQYRELTKVTQQIATNQFTVTTSGYDKRGYNTVKTEDAALAANPAGLNIVTQTTYDAFGRAVATIDGNHNLTQKQYDRLGRVVHITDALGQGSSLSYDSFDRQLTMTDANNNVTTFIYNDVENSVVTVLPTGVSSKIISNQFGEKLTVVDAAGNTTSYGYDANGNLTTITAPSTPVNTVVFDVLNRVTESTDAKGIVTRNTYDAVNRLITQTVDAGAGGLAITTQYQYSEQGRVLVTIDPNGIQTKTINDLNGKAVQIIRDPNGLGEYTSFSYDGLGNKLTVTKGYIHAGVTTIANTTNYQYDALNRLQSETNNGADTTYTYDADGNVVAKTDGNGNRTYSVYDADNRLIYALDPQGFVSEYHYDANGNQISSTRYAKAIAIPATVTAGAIANAVTIDAQHDQTSYTLFDAQNRKLYEIDPSGYVKGYSYDNLGHVIATKAYANPIVVSGQPTVAMVIGLLLASPLAGVNAQPGNNVSGQDVSGTLHVDPNNRYANSSVAQNDTLTTTSSAQTVNNGVVVHTDVPPVQPVPLTQPSSNASSVDDTRAVSVQVSNASVVQTSYIQNHQYVISPAPAAVSYTSLPAGVALSDVQNISGDNQIAAAILQQPLQVTTAQLANTASGYSFNAVDSGLLTQASIDALASDTVTAVTATIHDSAGHTFVVSTPLSYSRTATFNILVQHTEKDTNGNDYTVTDFDFRNKTVTQTFSIAKWNGQINLGNLAQGHYTIDLKVDYVDQNHAAQSYDTTTAGYKPLAVVIGTPDVEPTVVRWNNDIQPGNTSVEFLYGSNNTPATVATQNGFCSVSLSGLTDGNYAFTINYRDRVTHQVVRTLNGVFTSTRGAQTATSVTSAYSVAGLSTGNAQVLSGYISTLSNPPSVDQVSSIQVTIVDKNGQQVGQVTTDPLRERLRFGYYGGDMLLAQPGSVLANGSYTLNVAITLLDGTVRNETLHYEIGLQSVAKERLQWSASSPQLLAGGQIVFRYGAGSTPGVGAHSVTVSQTGGYYVAELDNTSAGNNYWFDIAYLDRYGHVVNTASGTFTGVALDNLNDTPLIVNFVNRAATSGTASGTAIAGYLLPGDAAAIDYATAVSTDIDTGTTYAPATTYIDVQALANNTFNGNLNLRVGQPLPNGRYSVAVTLHYLDGHTETRPAFSQQIGQVALANQALTQFNLGVVNFPPNTVLKAQYQAADGSVLPMDVVLNNGTVILAVPQLNPSAPGATDNYSVALTFIDQNSGQPVRQLEGQLTISATAKTLHFTDHTASAYKQQLFRYDALGRKVFEATNFDAQGNAFVKAYQYDNNNQLIGEQQFGAAVAFSDSTTTQNLQQELSALTNPLATTTLYQYDNAGRRTQTTVNGQSQQATFDKAGNQLTATDANGDTTYFVYDSNNRLAYQFAPVNAHLSGSVFANQGYSQHTNDFIVSQFDYDALDHVKTERLYTNYVTLNAAQISALSNGQFDSQTVTNASARITANSYNAQGLLDTRTVTSSGGLQLESVKYLYDGFGNVVTEIQGYSTTDANAGAKTQRTYDKNNRLIAETQGFGTSDAATTSYRYDAFGNQVAITDARGNALANSDSAWARQTRIAAGKAEYVANLSAADKNTLRALYTITSTYDQRGFKVAETDMLGYTRTIMNDAYGNPIKITAPDGSVSYLYYDDQQQLRAQINSLGVITWNTYDGLGQIIKQTVYATPLAAGSYNELTTLTALDTLLNKLPSKDHTTQWEYDAQQRVKTITDALGNTQSFTYDGEGNQLSKTDQENRTTYYLYDGNNRKIGERSADLDATATGFQGYFTDIEYNVLGQAKSSGNIVSGTGVSQWSYDDLGQQTEILQSNGRDLKKAYDIRGNVISETDGDGNVTHYYYNAVNQRIAMVDAEAYLTQFEYDPVGNLITQKTYANKVAVPTDSTTLPTAPTGAARVVAYQYNRNGLRTSQTIKAVDTYEVSGGFGSGDLVTQTDYDVNGHAVSVTDARGNVTRMYYDALGEMVLSVDAGGGVTRLQYDNFGNVKSQTQYAQALNAAALSVLTAQSSTDSILQQITASSSDRVIEYGYDQLNRKVEERIVGVGYSVWNNGIEHRDGDLVNTYEYDNVGNVTKLTQTGKATGSTVSLSTTDTNVVVQETRYTYDGLNRLVLEEHPQFIDFENVAVRQRIRLAYDYNGNITNEAYLDKNGNVGKQQTYTFIDGLLDHESGYKGVIAYTYDNNGNIKTRTDTINSKIDTYSYDGRNQIKTLVTAGINGVSGTQTNFYAYDAFGQLTNRGRRFDANTAGPVYQEYFNYDNAGRVFKTNNGDGVDRFYFYDRAGHQTLEVRSQGTSASMSLAALTVASLRASTNTNVFQIKATEYDALGRARYTYQAANTSGFSALSGSLENAAAYASLHSNHFIKTEMQYDIFGDKTAEIDGRGNTTHWTYDVLGNQTSATLPSVTFYDEHDAATSSTQVTHNYYDIHGRLVGMADTAGKVTWQSWANDQVQTVTDAVGTGNAATRTTKYDALGDKLSMTDAMNWTNTLSYNYGTDGQYVVTVAIDGGNWTDGGVTYTYTYQYDNDLVSAQRSYRNQADTANIVQTQNFTYDALGQLTHSTDYWGTATNYSYTPTANNANQKRTTTDALGHGMVVETDYFNRVINKWDLSGRLTTYSYDQAGQIVLAQTSGSTTASVVNSASDAHFTATGVDTGSKSVSYQYFTTGKSKQISDTAQGTTTTFNYDANGNITAQGEVAADGSHLDTSVSYDNDNRAISIGATHNGTSAYSLSYGYDASGNRRFVTGSALRVDGTTKSISYWYTYDSLDRLLINEGTLIGGTISRGSVGVNDTGTTYGTEISYDAAGRRTQEINGSDTIRYEYHDTTGGHTVDTYKNDVKRSTQTFNQIGQLLSTVVYDQNSHYVKTTTDTYTNGLKTQEHVVYSNNDGYDAIDDTNTTYTYDAAGNLTQSQNTNVPHSNGTAVTSTDKYSYILLDSYQQRAITIVSSDNTDGYSQSVLSYNGNGYMSSVSETDSDHVGTPQRTMSYRYDFGGNVTQRTSHSVKDGDRSHNYYYLDSVAIGDTGNDDTTRLNYITDVDQAIHSALDPTQSNYQKPADVPKLFTDFDGNFSVSNPDLSASSYAALAGDTLQSIAQKIYGDSSLWFLLADANGLSGSTPLSPGQSIQIPNEVHSVHNTATTYRPYDSSETVRSTLPDAPPPPHVDECKRIASIIIAVLVTIFVVVLTVITMGAASELAPLAVLAIGAAVGAVGAVAANAVIQGVNIALGLQKEFDWKSMVIDGIVGLVTGGLAGVGTIVSAAENIGRIARVAIEVGLGAATGFVESTLRQGLGIAFHTQDKFDWTQVAIGTGIGGASGAVSGALGKLAKKEATAAATEVRAETRAAENEVADVEESVMAISRQTKVAEPGAVGLTARGAVIARGVFISAPTTAARVLAKTAQRNPMALGAVADFGVAAGATAAMSAANGEPFDFSYFMQMAVSNAAGRGAGSNRSVQKAVAKLRSVLPQRFTQAPVGKDTQVLVVHSEENNNAEINAQAYLQKGNGRRLAGDDLSSSSQHTKTTVIGEGGDGTIGGLTPKQLVQNWRDRGVKELGPLSLVSCNSVEFARQLHIELNEQGIPHGKITARNGLVSVLPDGTTVVKKDNGDIVRKGTNTKVVVGADGEARTHQYPRQFGDGEPEQLRNDLDDGKRRWLETDSEDSDDEAYVEPKSAASRTSYASARPTVNKNQGMRRSNSGNHFEFFSAVRKQPDGSPVVNQLDSKGRETIQTHRGPVQKQPALDHKIQYANLKEQYDKMVHQEREKEKRTLTRQSSFDLYKAFSSAAKDTTHLRLVTHQEHVTFGGAKKAGEFTTAEQAEAKGLIEAHLAQIATKTPQSVSLTAWERPKAATPLEEVSVKTRTQPSRSATSTSKRYQQAASSGDDAMDTDTE